jgi:hypothetical protein
MAIRNGMVELVSQFRSYLSEKGTVIFTDDRLEQLLDSNSEYIRNHYLASVPSKLNGSVVYYDYFASYQYIEGTASSTTKLYNSNGTTVVNYASDFFGGKFTFDTNTLGTAYYLEGKSFNFFKAVSDGWKEKASYYATQFDFTVEGRGYKKSQVITSCLAMAKEYSSKSTPIQHSLDRGDLC